MVRSPARSLRLQFSERYTGQSTVPLPIAGQGSNRAEGPTRRRRRSRPLPGATGWPERSTSAPPRPAHGRHHPTAPARRRLVASRQPWALSVLPIRNGSSRTGRGPEQAPIRTSSTRLAGEPAHRSATRPGATAHRRTPEPLRRARHSARTARPEASAHDRTGVTSAVTIDILLRPTATEPDRHERPGAQRVRRPQPHQDHTAQHQPAQPRHRGAAVATATIEITAGQLDPAAVGDLLILLKYEMQSYAPRSHPPRAPGKSHRFTAAVVRRQL